MTFSVSKGWYKFCEVFYIDILNCDGKYIVVIYLYRKFNRKEGVHFSKNEFRKHLFI